MTDTNPTIIPLQPECRKAFEAWRELLAKQEDAVNQPAIGMQLEDNLRAIFIAGGAIPNSRSGVRGFTHLFKPNKPRAVMMARHLSKMVGKIADTYLTGEDYVDPVTGLSTRELIIRHQQAMTNTVPANTRDLVSQPGSAPMDTRDALFEDTFSSLVSHNSVMMNCSVAVCHALYKREYKHEMPMMKDPTGHDIMAVRCVHYPAAYGLMYVHGMVVKSAQNNALACLPEDQRRSVLGELVLRGSATPEDMQRGYLVQRPLVLTTFTPPASRDTGPGPGSGTVH